jgi:two-component system, NarL family, response regulator
MTNPVTIRILIADDHPPMREGLAVLLGLQPDLQVVALAKDGLETIALYQQYQPDVLLMDLSMPGMEGSKLVAAIRAEFASARIIILTTYDGEEDIYRSLRAGACGYLLKDIPSKELFDVIRKVNAGQKYLMNQVAVKLTERLQGEELTERELEVLALMIQGKSNHEIGEALCIVNGTVKFHVRNILQKLDVSDRTQAIIAALKRGFFHL